MLSITEDPGKDRDNWKSQSIQLYDYLLRWLQFVNRSGLGVVPHQGQRQFLLGLALSQGNKENVEPVTNMGNVLEVGRLW